MCAAGDAHAHAHIWYHAAGDALFLRAERVSPDDASQQFNFGIHLQSGNRSSDAEAAFLRARATALRLGERQHVIKTHIRAWTGPKPVDRAQTRG